MSAYSLTAPIGCTNYKLRSLLRRVSVVYEREMASTGLKTTQYSVLTHIEKLAPITQAALAIEMGMDSSTLSRNLKPLVASGWVAIESGEDARSHTLSLTKAGVAKRAEAKRAWKRAQLALNERLGVANVAHLHDVIDQINNVLLEQVA
ncbi:MAG: MarR family transcriptional regulator [Betaproteobacteria bacterium]|nr:MAG: MarR family transcriptional regulator [Betaproteobacteria bacterium]